MWKSIVDAWNYLSLIDLAAIVIVLVFVYKKGWSWVSAKIGSAFAVGSSAVARLEALEVAVFGTKQPIAPAQTPNVNLHPGTVG